MRIQISLSKGAVCPPLKTFLNKEDIKFVEKWVRGAGGISSELEKKGMSALKHFNSIHEQMKTAGLVQSITAPLYRGVHLNVEDFVQMIRTGALPPRSDVSSWSTSQAVALRYLSGIQSKKRLPFGLVFKVPSAHLDIVADLRGIEDQIDSQLQNEEIIAKDVSLKSTFAVNISVPMYDKKAQKDAMVGLNTLYEEGLLLDKPDADFLIFRIDAEGKLKE
jgi:hypothetical protein